MKNKPYINKLIHMKLLDHKGGFALEVGQGSGDDTNFFESLGYKVVSFDKKEGTDLREFIFEKDTYDFINCNNVLPFIHDKDEVAKALFNMSKSLRVGGTLHFTLFGENDPWAKEYPEKMSFYTFRQANEVVDALELKCVLRVSEECMGKTNAGEDKYWHIMHFACIKT